MNEWPSLATGLLACLAAGLAGGVLDVPYRCEALGACLVLLTMLVAPLRLSWRSCLVWLLSVWLMVHWAPAWLATLGLASYLLFVARDAQASPACVATQVGYGLVLFVAVDVLLLRQPTVQLLTTHTAIQISRLLFEAYSRPGILADDLLGAPAFFMLALLAFPSQPSQRRGVLYVAWVIYILILVLAFLGLRIRLGIAETFLTCLPLAVVSLLAVSKAKGTPPLTGLPAWPLMASAGLLLMSHGLPWLTQDWPRIDTVPRHQRILVVQNDDKHKVKMGQFDFLTMPLDDQEFLKTRDAPTYDTVFRKLLPALGYEIEVIRRASLSTIAPEDFDLVVLICLQEELEKEWSERLLMAVQNGTTNLLLAGDHTDIGGVQKPFNSLSEPLGVSLVYDSVFPLGRDGWDGNLRRLPHPLNGSMAFSEPHQGSGLGMSVGASLDIDWTCVFPVIMSGDGYSDRGTPDAPELAGLGDRAYTINEARGGQVLVAERFLGKGRVLFFGDTAFLQNSSVTRHFGFAASVFEYASSHAGVVWTPYLLQSRWIFAFITLGMLGCRMNVLVASGLVLALATGASWTAVQRSDTSLLRCMAQVARVQPVVIDKHYVIDKKATEIYGLIELLESSTTKLVVESDALAALAMVEHPETSVGGIVWLAPRTRLSSRQISVIESYVAGGGHMLVATGYIESDTIDLMLSRFECRITGTPLGAGQQSTVALPGFGFLPPIEEAWALELSADWRKIVTCFGQAIMADRRFKHGRVGVIGDSFLLFDSALKPNGPYQIAPSAVRFYRRLFFEIFEDS